eukprot:g52524.t1
MLSVQETLKTRIKEIKSTTSLDVTYSVKGTVVELSLKPGIMSHIGHFVETINYPVVWCTPLPVKEKVVSFQKTSSIPFDASIPISAYLPYSSIPNSPVPATRPLASASPAGRDKADVDVTI